MARARLLVTLNAIHQIRTPEAAHALIVDLLPSTRSSALTADDVETLRQRRAADDRESTAAGLTPVERCRRPDAVHSGGFTRATDRKIWLADGTWHGCRKKSFLLASERLWAGNGGQLVVLIAGRHRSPLVVIAPPPWPPRPHLSKRFARQVARAAAREEAAGSLVGGLAHAAADLSPASGWPEHTHDWGCRSDHPGRRAGRQHRRWRSR